MKRYRYTGEPQTVRLSRDLYLRRGEMLGIGADMKPYLVTDTSGRAIEVRPVALTRRYRAWVFARYRIPYLGRRLVRR